MSTAPQLDQDSGIAIARLRRSFDDGLAGHAVAAPDGRILACNPEFARIIGVGSVDDAMSVNLHELEPRPGAFLTLLRRLSDSPLIPLEELSFVRRDGTPAQVLARLAATVDGAGRVSEIRVYLVDITQRFREEQKLRACAERFQLAELATQDVLWDWDVTTARIEWSGATARRFRYTADEVQPAMDWHAERIHPEDRERVMRGVQRALLGIDSVWADEYRLLRGDGSYATVLDRAHVARNGRGEPVRVVGSILDITELKAMEEANRFLARASAALESALAVDATAATLARVGIPGFAEFCLVDLLQEDGSLRRAAVAHARPGLEPALQPDTVIADGPDADSAPLDAVHTGMAECVAGAVRPLDRLARRLGVGVEADVHAFMVIPISARGRTMGSVTFGFSSPRRYFDPLHLMTGKDLAGRAGLALDNALLYQAARQAVQSRNEVLGVVSHDLRVPVHTIVATLALLSDSMAERRSDVRKLFDILHRATGQIDNLIRDLLDMSRIESKQFTVEPRASNVLAMVTEACDTLRTIAAARQITISSHVEEDTPPVAADAPGIVRVIGNLLGNAIKFSPRGAAIAVHAGVCDGELRISVHDDGPGIEADQVPRVFERFWQGHRNDRRGTGLGLAISRGIVEAHGGRIWVDTEVNSGSTFTFALPIGDVTPDGRADAPDQTRAAGPGQAAARPEDERVPASDRPPPGQPDPGRSPPEQSDPSRPDARRPRTRYDPAHRASA